MVIAARTLLLDDVTPIEVSIEAPKRDGEGWCCRYSIGWPMNPVFRSVFGIDSAQALLQAFYFVGTDLYSSEYHAQRRLTLDGRSGHFGFPVPAIIRDSVSDYEDM